MPNYTPASRYLLAGMAILMLFAALPTAGDAFQAILRSYKQNHVERTRVERIRVLDVEPLDLTLPIPDVVDVPLAPPAPERW